MLEAISRDGVYKISAPSNARTTRTTENQDKYDRTQDVYLEVIAGKKANVSNLARAIFYDCFVNDLINNSGLCLLTAELKCHVKTEKGSYEFIVPNYDQFGALLDDIAELIEM